jgi:hypothetical protein
MTVLAIPTVEHPPAPTPLCLAALADTVCLCGGLLGAFLGELVHVDACADCWERPGRCPDRAGHVACDQPDPALCAHLGCYSPHSIASAACAAGHEHCCGCCHGEL